MDFSKGHGERRRQQTKSSIIKVRNKIFYSIFSPISVKDAGVECGHHSRNKVDVLFGLTPERIIFNLCAA